MRLVLAAVSLLVACSTACTSTSDRTPPLLDRSAAGSETVAVASGLTTTEVNAPTEAASSSAVASDGSGTYVVQSGDYLARIALNHGVTVAALSEANGITDPTLIYPGQVLTVPGGVGALAPSELPVSAVANLDALSDAAAHREAEVEPPPAGPALVQRGIERLPFELPTVVQAQLDELLAREGGDVLAIGVLLAVGGVALYVVIRLVSAVIQLVRFAVGSGARGALAAARVARGGALSTGRGISSISGAASRFGAGQALATAGAASGGYPDAGEYEADAAEALRHHQSVGAAPVTVARPASVTPGVVAPPRADVALPPVEEPEVDAEVEPEAAAPPRPVQRSAATGGARADATREAFSVLIESWRRAVLLDRDLYAEAGSVDATRVQAARVLIFSTVVGGLGWLLHGPAACAAATIALLLGWAAQIGATHVLATRGHYAPKNVDGLARAFALALAPAALLPLTMLPLVGVAIGLVVFGWILAATIVAVESTLHLSITEALESAVPGWLVLWVAPLVAVQIVI